jgi:hypothetical protein
MPDPFDGAAAKDGILVLFTLLRLLTLFSSSFPLQGQDSSQHYVRASLSIKAPAGYPESGPACTLSNTRGLTDAFCNDLASKLRDEIKELKGECCCYQLFELAGEALTEANFSGNTPIA